MTNVRLFWGSEVKIPKHILPVCAQYKSCAVKMPDIKAKSRPANKSFGNSNANKNIGSFVVGNNSQNQNNANSQNQNKIGNFGGNNKKSREIDSVSTGLTGYNSTLQQSADNPEIHSNNQQQQSHNGKPVLHVLYTTGSKKF